MAVLHSGATYAHADMVTGGLPDTHADTKAQLRTELLAARRNVPDEVRAVESRALAGHLDQVTRPGDTVCAYVPMGTEPGSADLVDRLLELCGRLLLPVTRIDSTGTPLPLQWGEYLPGRLTAGRYGLLEPAEPWLPASAIANATVILVPALAVDRRGVRLGRGGGFYDRSLPLRSADSKLIAVVRDPEIVEELPSEAHDIRMTHALTPGAGVITFSNMH